MPRVPNACHRDAIGHCGSIKARKIDIDVATEKTSCAILLEPTRPRRHVRAVHKYCKLREYELPRLDVGQAVVKREIKFKCHVRIAGGYTRPRPVTTDHTCCRNPPSRRQRRF